MVHSVFWRKYLWIALIVGVTGCGRTPLPLEPLNDKPTPAPELAANFDAQTAGAIHGRVIWSGPLPESHAFRDAGIVPGTHAAFLDMQNPMRPRIDPKGHGLASAVVFLRKVDPLRSKSWDPIAPRIEMKPSCLIVEQGGEQRVGFVRVGASVEMISHIAGPESLRARGAAFFTLAFPKPEQPLQRTFAQSGLIEFSSAMGNYWERCWLFVAEHPYFVRTDATGNFSLEQVPDGTYELVCWIPDWRIERVERDPETFATARLWYRKPLEKSMTVKVERGRAVVVAFSVGMSDFGQIAR